MSDLATRVEAVRALLVAAARDDFDRLESMGDLGASLRRTCDRAISRIPDDAAPRWSSWRRTLECFDELELDQREIEVARGLRLCQTLVGARRPALARPRASTPRLDSTVSLPGIGPKLAERLAERGLWTVEDLLWFVPRRYDDVRTVLELDKALSTVEPGERVCVYGTVASCRFFRRGRRRWLDVRVSGDNAASLAIRWFNAHPPMAKRFPVGSRLAVSGKLSLRASAAEMANPDVLGVRTPDGTLTELPERIIPRYTEVPGVPAATMRKACRGAVERALSGIPDAVPPQVAERQGLPPLEESLRALHAPPDDLSVEDVVALCDGTSRWHRRLAFDELFVLGLAVAARRRRRRSDRGVPCAEVEASELDGVFPFALTAAQRRAIESVSRDLGRDAPMNRLLQGDVGCGKTAVAFAAAHQVLAAGHQVVVMAPTEILAQQHRASLEPWCRACGFDLALLTASTPKGVRASTLSLLAAGRLSMIVGTHSVLADAVGFHSLGLVVIDEQHRFGVAQRVRLRNKGLDAAPHLLVMTATPIPRTLALTAYGDLDVSVIDELPPGRTPPKTRVVGGQRGREGVYQRLAARVAAKQQAFVVCPLVEPSEDPDAGRNWRDATTTAAELADRLAPARVGLAHGRMAQAERDVTMDQFRDGELDVLVATTVVEVGVDIPNATIMVIEDAHHFGLSQLHQLRGRVGRGGGEAHCILLTRGTKTAEGARRLEVMAETTDGFRIAEEDLQIRGPGELLGVRQAGLPRMRFGDLTQHAELLVKARSEAERLLDDNPTLDRPEHAPLRLALEERAGVEQAFGAEGG